MKKKIKEILLDPMNTVCVLVATFVVGFLYLALTDAKHIVLVIIITMTINFVWAMGWRIAFFADLEEDGKAFFKDLKEKEGSSHLETLKKKELG